MVLVLLSGGIIFGNGYIRNRGDRLPFDTSETEPIRPLVFAILVSLSDHDRHGYGIMKVLNRQLRRRALLGPGTLYRTLAEMRERGLIDYAAAPDDADARRRYYRLTAEGRRVAQSEAKRMAEWVDIARSSRLLGESGE